MAINLVYLSVAIYLALHWICNKIYDSQLATETCMNEIEQLGSPKCEKKLGTVVIAGGSVAGLLTARACCDHFDNIIVLEPEAPLDPTVKRARVPQNKALHALLAIANVALEKWFPHLEETCLQDGVRILPAGVNNYVQGIPFKPANNPRHLAVAASRPGYEKLLRSLVLGGKYPNIDYRQYKTVSGITISEEDKNRVESVTTRSADGVETIVKADLVVDCTGPARQGLLWLEKNGFTNPQELESTFQTFDPKMRYATFTVEVPEEIKPTLPIPGGFDNAGTILTCYGLERDNRVLFSMKIEGDRMYAGCGVYGAGKLPKDMAELTQIAREMNNVRPLPDWFFDMLERISGLESTVEYVRSSPSSLVKYQDFKTLPSNYVAIGDAVMRVNPIYGQGCSKATIGAVMLDTLLSRYRTSIPSTFSREFFDIQHQKTQGIWENTQIADYGQPTTTPCKGDSLAKGSFLRWYAGHLQSAACVDPKVAEIFLSTRMMIKPSVLMVAPTTIARILWFNTFGG